MKDKLGKPLAIGDDVIFILPNYRELHTAKIIAFTKCFVRIEYVSRDYTLDMLQSPEQLVKVDLTL
jgi:hypothetical protein